MHSTSILLGSILLLIGLVLYLFPPKKVNHLYGYRTPASKKNIEAWTFSQRYSAKWLIAIGAAINIFGLSMGVFQLTDFELMIYSMIIMIVGFILLFFFTERNIKKLDTLIN